MFHVGNIPTLDQEQFGDFRSCLGIFNNSTKLQKNRKRKKQKGKTYLAPATRPTCRPSPAPRQRAACGQAGRQVLDGEHRMGATHLLAASPLPSPGDAMDRSPSLL